MLAIESPLPLFVGRDGLPLDAGYIYFGTVNLNPVTSPVTVYWDAAGTQPVAQPVRTSRGLIVRSGTPAKVYASGNFSMLVKDSSGTQVVYERNSSEWQLDSYVDALRADLASTSGVDNGDALIGVKKIGITGALSITQHDVNEARCVNAVLDFGVSHTNTRSQNDSAMYTALNSGAKTIYIPPPPTGQKYLFSARWSILAASLGVTVYGEHTKNTVCSWAIDSATSNKFAIELDANVTLYGFTIENTGTDVTNSVGLCSSTPTEENGMHDCQFPDFRIVGFGRGVGASTDGISHTMVRSQAFSCRGHIEFDGCGIPIALGVGCNDNDLSCTFLNTKGSRHLYLIEGMNNRIKGRFEPVHSSVTSGFLNGEFIRCVGTHIRGYMEPCYGFLADSSPGTVIEPECEGFDWTVGTLSSSAILRSTNASNAGVFASPIISRVVLPVSRAATNPTSYAVSDDNAYTLTLVDAIVGRDANFKKHPSGQPNGEDAVAYRGVLVPTLTGTSGTSVNTYTQQQGWYYRVGQQVTAYMRVALSAIDAGMGGNAQVGPLPFPAIADTLYAACANLGEYQIDLSAGFTQLMGELTAGGTHVLLVQGGDNVAPIAVPASGVLSNTNVIMQITYITDAE